MRLNRADPYLNDAIAALDQRLHQARRQAPKSTTEDQRRLAWELLSSVEKQFIYDETARCANQRTYYLQNYHVIQPENGVPTCLNPLFDHQWMVENTLVLCMEIDGRASIIVLKPRQSGLTEYCSGVMCWRTFFLPHAYTISVAQAPDVAAHIQRKIVLTYNSLPWWMQSEQLYKTKGEYIEFGRKDISSGDAGLGSVMVTTHAMRTTGIAIGRTVRSAHLSEVSRWTSGEVWTGDIEPSMNAPDSLVFAESTAYGNEGFYYNLWLEAMAGDSDWTPVFLAAYQAKKYSLPLKPSQLPFVPTPTEAAFTEKIRTEEGFEIGPEFWNWRRRRIKASISRTGFPYAHYESYPITPQEAFQSSGMGAFPRHKLDEQQQRNVRKPDWVGEILFQGRGAAPKVLLNSMLDPSGHYRTDVALEKRELTNRLYVWEQPNPSAAYYIGVDVGDGILGGDFSVAEVFRAGYGAEPDYQVAEWVGYEAPLAFSRILYALGMWFNQCEIAVEYAREGMACANALTTELEYPKLYRPMRPDKAMGNPYQSYFHWQTTSKTKPYLLTRMTESLLEETVVVRSQYALDELRRCVKEGVSFAGLGGHDDAAVALCFPAGTLVDTPDGGTPIERLRPDDLVFSDDGDCHKVVRHGVRRVDEHIVRLKVFGIVDHLVCTSEHPILARTRIGSCPVRLREPDWVEAGRLKKNDFVYVPMRKLPAARFSEDELYLLGWYLSDGWASKSNGGMSFTLSPKDDETRLCSILRSLINAHPTCYLSGPKRGGKHERRGTVVVKDFGTYKQVRAHNEWVNIFLRTYGGNPKAKAIHPDIVNSLGTLPLVATFLMGDGSQTSARMEIKAVQKNKAVLRNIHRMLLDHGIWASIYPDKRGRFELAICGDWVDKFIEQVPWVPFKAPLRVSSHPIARRDQEGYWAQIQYWSKEHFAGDVYNMEVADTHTYLVNGVAVHNCIAHYCTRETMPELRRGQNNTGPTAQTAGSTSSLLRVLHPPVGAVIYGIYDELTRMRGQKRVLAEAEALVAANPGWQIRPIRVSKANTAFSVIHHGTGLENELFRGGMDAREITPGLVTSYAAATGRLQGMWDGQGGWQAGQAGAGQAGQPGPPAADGSGQWDSMLGGFGDEGLEGWGELG